MLHDYLFYINAKIKVLLLQKLYQRLSAIKSLINHCQFMQLIKLEHVFISFIRRLICFIYMHLVTWWSNERQWWRRLISGTKAGKQVTFPMIIRRPKTAVQNPNCNAPKWPWSVHLLFDLISLSLSLFFLFPLTHSFVKKNTAWTAKQ